MRWIKMCLFLSAWFLMGLRLSLPVFAEEEGQKLDESVPADPFFPGNDAPVVPGSPDCQEPPSGAVPIVYQILYMQEITGSHSLAPDFLEPDPIAEDGINWEEIRVFDRQSIDSEEEYQRIFGQASLDIDWTEYRILVFQESTSYTFDGLGYTSYLSGIFQFRDTLHIETTSTHHGPCQGIAQQAEWFSFDLRNLFLLLPRFPGEIDYYFCSIGGCPPDIP